MTTSVDLVGASLLAVAGSAIGQSVNLRLTSTWAEAPQLYVALVGLAGVKKSPPLKWLVKPLSDVDQDMQDVYRRELAAWDEREPEERGPKPICRRAVVQDVTTESLAVIHAENPRGILAYRDELTAWVRSFNQYKGKGADRQFWLSNASGSPLQVDRKGGREALAVRNPLINVCGGLTPDNLGALAQDDMDGRKDHQADDGFIDRLVFAYPDEFPAQVWTEKELDSDSENLWPEVVKHLVSRPMIQDGTFLRPWFVKFTDKAKEVYVRWHDAHMDEVEPQLNEYRGNLVNGAFTKLDDASHDKPTGCEDTPEFSELNELNERISREKLRGPWSKAASRN
jgi:Protein of unknown function (DUF3987)